MQKDEDLTDEEKELSPSSTAAEIWEEARAARQLLQDARVDARYRAAVRDELRMRSKGGISPYVFYPVHAREDERVVTVATTLPEVQHALFGQEPYAVLQRDLDGLEACVEQEKQLRPLGEDAQRDTRCSQWERVIARDKKTGAVLWGGCGPSTRAVVDLLPLTPDVVKLSWLFQLRYALRAAYAVTGGMGDFPNLRTVRDLRVLSVRGTNLAGRTWVYVDAQGREWHVQPAQHRNLLVRLRLRVPDDEDEEEEAVSFAALCARFLPQQDAEHMEELFGHQFPATAAGGGDRVCLGRSFPLVLQ